MQDSEPCEMEGPIYLALGVAYQNSREYEEAIFFLNAGIKKCPDYWLLHNSLGLTYKILGEPQKAINSYRVAQELIVDSATSNETLITKDGKKNLVVDSPAAVWSRLKSSPDYCTVMNNIGGALIEIGNLEQAEEALQESIEFIPEGFDYPPPQQGLDLIKSILLRS